MMPCDPPAELPPVDTSPINLRHEADSALTRPVYWSGVPRTCEICAHGILPGRTIWTGIRGTRMCSACVLGPPAKG